MHAAVVIYPRIRMSDDSGRLLTKLTTARLLGDVVMIPVAVLISNTTCSCYSNMIVPSSSYWYWNLRWPVDWRWSPANFVDTRSASKQTSNDGSQLILLLRPQLISLRECAQLGSASMIDDIISMALPGDVADNPSYRKYHAPVSNGLALGLPPLARMLGC